MYTIHEGKKEYGSVFCEKSFPHKGNLEKTFIQLMRVTKITNVNIVINHFLKQTYKYSVGCRDHKCDICGKLFTEAGTLSKHASKKCI